VILVRIDDDDQPAISFDDANRLSTDEHNNLEIWGGPDGERLLYVCAASRWIDATILTAEPEE
jgi:hypothetical protein